MPQLEIGNHKRRGEDWTTLDILPPADIIADISKALPIEDESYSHIYMSHVLEHVVWYKTVDVLKELFRILEHKGTIEIHVPDIDRIIKAYEFNAIFDGWYKYNEERDPFIWLAGRIFTYGDNESDFHKAIFNKKHLTKCLEKAGFINICTVPERGNAHGYINLGIKGEKP